MAIIAASILYMGLPVPNTQSSSTASSSVQGGQSATLAIRLTDPPTVPHFTSSLNLTYSSLSLLVGEPTGTQGQLTTKSVAVTPSGGSATIDLLKLQNVSQTIALASLPSGSVLYSVTFTVTSITIDVNKTVSSVALATGGTSFQVTIARPSVFGTGDFALLQLNPVVVNTPTGYQLIPSAVGVMGHEGNGPEEVGSRHDLTNGDNDNLHNAHGNVNASLVALAVSGNITTLTIKVNNSANFPVELNALGLHGNFTVYGNLCHISHPGMGDMSMANPDSHSTHTKTSTGDEHCLLPMHMNEIVFVPLAPSASTSTTTSTSTSTSTTQTSSASCTPGQMSLVNMMGDSDHRGLTLNAGQCVILTFVGKLSFGESNLVIVPSTSAGQVYVLHVIGSNGANQEVSCTLPLGANSCKVSQPQPDSQDW